MENTREASREKLRTSAKRLIVSPPARQSMRSASWENCSGTTRMCCAVFSQSACITRAVFCFLLGQSQSSSMFLTSFYLL